jgi:plasmid stabilization system protein ParE
MRQIIFTPAAEADLYDALDWYAQNAPSLVSQIRAQLHDLTLRMATAPLRFAPGPKGTRRAFLRQFPYVVVFKFTDETVYIIAFFHTRRDPLTWQQRI